MMDLDESLRALYFAPLPLIVLDQNRNVKMLNRPAEIVLGIGNAHCAGQRLEKYIAPTYRTTFTVALNEAAENYAKTSSGFAQAVPTRLMIQPVEGQTSIWADLSISAWYATDTLFGSGEGDRSVHGRDSADTSPNAASSPYSMDTANRGLVSASPAVHEALFTLTVIPSRAGIRETSPTSDAKIKIADILKESAFNTIDTAVMALSKNAGTVIRNKACDEVLASFSRVEPKAIEPGDEEKPFDLDFINEMMECYTEDFSKPMAESDWPLYKTTFLGQPAAPVAVGVISKSTGEKSIMEVAGKPIRDNSGYGEHIGGLITLRNITAERTRFQEKAEEQGDLYFKQTCDAMPQLVWVTSPTGYHEWYSKSWYEYTGCSPYESQGAGWQGFFHEEDMPEAGKRWSHSLRTGDLYETAYRCKRYDGAWRWFLGRALPMRDRTNGQIVKWFGTCTDIHDQVEALSASRRAQTQLESVINHAAMTLWAVDREGLITIAEGPGVRQLKLMGPGTPASEREQGSGGGFYNRSEHESEHYSTGSGHSSERKSMIGRSIYSIWDSTNIREAMNRALNGEAVVEEMEMDGRWFRTSYTPLRAPNNEANTVMEGNDMEYDEENSDSKIVGVVGASMDITDRKRAQEQMEESLLEKTRALAAEGAAREASRLKSEFLANMSHEIRTPIAGVIGLSELLLDEKGLTPQHRDYAETIQRSAEGLLTVINDVLDFSKVEIGKLDVEKAPFNLEVLLRDAKRMLSFATQKKGLDFRDSVDLTYKGQVIGDVGRLRQVITNLLTNAIKFTARGYISLEVAELSEDNNNLLVRFDVRDTGCGINPESLARLFQPFSQADPSTARRFGGTGLGLSISKNLVELMNGEIGLNSVENQGSHAWFVIPFRKASAREDEERSRILEANVESPASTSGYIGGMPIVEKTSLTRDRKDIFILIAEDNVVNAQIASKNIKKMGFNCRTAENGLLALEELNKNSYDAVLMDCQMPECDGYEATRLIRKSLNPDIRMLPVIALTASAIKGDRERALDAGMVDYLAKPVKRPALEATLCKWLYDDDARQSLSKFFSTTSNTSPRNRANASSGTARNVPTSSVKWNENVQVAKSVSSSSQTDGNNKNSTIGATSMEGLKSPSQPKVTSEKGHARKLSSGTSSSHSETVIETLKSPKLDVSSVLFRNGDALSAAAALLTARRASAEALEIKKSIRPPLSPRSQSHGSSLLSSTSSIPHSINTSDTSVSSEDNIRRSSREQAGLGRDLDGEVFRATFGNVPSLKSSLGGSQESLEKGKGK